MATAYKLHLDNVLTDGSTTGTLVISVWPPAVDPTTPPSLASALTTISVAFTAADSGATIQTNVSTAMTAALTARANSDALQTRAAALPKVFTASF